MRRFLPTLTLLLATGWLPAADVPLSISGDTVTVVKSLPFKVTAAPGADVYIWNHPSSVKSSEDENVLTITEAPKGEVTVKIQTITIDWAAKKTVKARGSVTFVVGAVPPGPGPDPGPTPPDPTPVPPLVKALRDAYAAETDAEKSSRLKALAGLYATAAEQVTQQKPATMGAVWKAIEAGAKAAGVNGKILRVQTVVQGEWKRLPTKSTDALDDTKRALVVSVFSEVADALARVEVKR